MSPPFTSVCCGWRHRLDDFVDMSARAEPPELATLSPRRPQRRRPLEQYRWASRLSNAQSAFAQSAAARFAPGTTAPDVCCVPARTNEQRPDPPSTRSPATKPHPRCAHVTPDTLDASRSDCSAQPSSPRHTCFADTYLLRSQSCARSTWRSTATPRSPASSPPAPCSTTPRSPAPRSPAPHSSAPRSIGDTPGAMVVACSVLSAALRPTPAPDAVRHRTIVLRCASTCVLFVKTCADVV